LHDVPETRLPPAAIAAAGEYDLIEHLISWCLVL